MKSVELAKGRIRLRLQLVHMGTDICLILTGGDRPHLGAVAVAQHRESLAEPGKISATVSNITLLGHKEDILARDIAARISAVAAVNVAVCCGIHLDNILPDEIEDIFVMCKEMTDEMFKT